MKKIDLNELEALVETYDFRDSVGRFKTQSLFIESLDDYQAERGTVPIYSLTGKPSKRLIVSKFDHIKSDYIGLKDVYMTLEDPTEYAFAMAAFGSWQHFQLLSGISWFKEPLTEWRLELEIRLRSKAIKAMLATATSESRGSTAAAKWIADRGWDVKRGRPSKEEVEREKKIAAGITDEIHEDANRLGIH